ncbi:shikimate kinase [Mongoliitalea daihaiensis]|uniref:shikimate kinase n=1 Tax=Mongoliitalea daihaiensis TaxID=2782006 RepID=UPI001F458B11|nr:shikimate kinase [Mongoliitalea daihaiensis]UJP63294.1 shikimate kinase [Mongoliitalea daihaiensis]
MNKNNLKIVLVGLPGCGKSTFGKILADELGFPFIDLDQYIEQEEHKSISTIFQELGEGTFRKLETYYLEKVLEGFSSLVLSTGGGTPCFHDNMERINAVAISIFLDVPITTIHQRLIYSGSVRPLFSGLDSTELKTRLEDLSQIRSPYYQLSKIKLSGDDVSTEQVYSELLHYFKS